MWKYVKFFRKNKMQLDIFKGYLDTVSVKKDKDIMSMVEKLYDTSSPNYSSYIKKLKDEIAKNKIKKDEKYSKQKSKPYMFVNVNDDDDELTSLPSGYMFVDDKGEPKTPSITKTAKTAKTTKSTPVLLKNYMFMDN